MRVILANTFRQLSVFIATTVSSPTVQPYRWIDPNTTLNKWDTVRFIRIPYIYNATRETLAILNGMGVA